MPTRAPNPTPLPGPPAGLLGAALSRWVIGACTSPEPGGLAFTAAGICETTPPPAEDAAVFTRWLAEGRHGDMAYLAEQAAERLDPRRVLPGARAVVMVADRYHPRDGGRDAQAEAERDGSARGVIARFARGRDYHGSIKRRLHRLADALRQAFPGTEFRSFADTAPVLERRFAQRAGLGWLAKNAMLIHPRHGSYLLLGGFLTTLDLPAPGPDLQPLFTDFCGSCTRCIDACPTGAIARQPLAGPGGARVDGARCISYLTIEHRGEIDPELAARVGDRVFGCDACQEVCPHNSARPSQPDQPVHAGYAPRRATIPLLEMAAWSDADRAAQTASPLKRAATPMLRRNALTALGNLGRTAPQAGLQPDTHR